MSVLLCLISEIEKDKFYRHKKPFLEDVDIKKVLVSNKIYSVE